MIREDDGGERVVVGNRMASGVHLGPSQADTPQLTIQQNATMQLESEKFPINQNFVMSQCHFHTGIQRRLCMIKLFLVLRPLIRCSQMIPAFNAKYLRHVLVILMHICGSKVKLCGTTNY